MEYQNRNKLKKGNHSTKPQIWKKICRGAALAAKLFQSRCQGRTMVTRTPSPNSPTPGVLSPKYPIKFMKWTGNKKPRNFRSSWKLETKHFSNLRAWIPDSSRVWAKVKATMMLKWKSGGERSTSNERCYSRLNPNPAPHTLEGTNRRAQQVRRRASPKCWI